MRENSNQCSVEEGKFQIELYLVRMGRHCGKGKPCGATCIYRRKICQIDLGNPNVDVSALRKIISARQTAPASPSSKEIAKEIIGRYRKEEPKLTALMAKLARDNNMELHGLKNRLKTEESLARKIESERGAFGGDVKKTADSIGDISRYTMVVPPKKYGESAEKVLSQLRDMGYQVRVKNYWGPPAGPYRGVNVALISPSGLKLELQFHTEKSREVKSKLHKLYEEFRVSSDPVRRKEIWDTMVSVSRRIPIPKGAVKVGGPSALVKRRMEDN